MHSTRATVLNSDIVELLNRFNAGQNTENIQTIRCDACCADDAKTDDGKTDFDAQYTKRMRNALNVQTQFSPTIDQCIEHAEPIENNQRIVLMASDSFASTILSVIHSYRSVSFIFIFCEHDNEYTFLLSQYSKIVNIYQGGNN